MDLATAVNRFRPAVEAELRAALGEDSSPFFGIMRYHLGWVGPNLSTPAAGGGKRLRPVICLLACEAVGGDPDRALPAAAAIELLHNFSLIHDDIEDGSDERHGRPTVWKLWGEPQAINAGDGMHVLARAALWRLPDRGAPADLVLTTARRLDETCLRLCGGQYLDMSFEERVVVTPDEYLEMIAGKSAALIAYSAETGARLGGADAAFVERYRRFGEELGIAFQMRDDILGIWGDEAATGKSAISDILEKKKSLPVVHALTFAQGNLRERLAEIYRQPEIGPADVPEVVEILNLAGSRHYSQAHAERHAAEALSQLGPEPGNEAQQALRALVEFIVAREY